MGFFHWLHKDVYREICRLEKQIMSNQDEINELAARTNAATENILAKIAELEAQPGAEVLDFTDLKAAVGRVEDADGVPGADGPTPPEATPPVTNPVV